MKNLAAGESTSPVFDECVFLGATAFRVLVVSKTVAEIAAPRPNWMPWSRRLAEAGRGGWTGTGRICGKWKKAGSELGCDKLPSERTQKVQKGRNRHEKEYQQKESEE
jgi:hypothetical protein